MEINSIVKLQNKEFILLEDVFLDDIRYIYAVEVQLGSDEPTNNYCYFQEVQKEGKCFFSVVVDEEIKKQLLLLFANNYINNALGGA